MAEETEQKEAKPAKEEKPQPKEQKSQPQERAAGRWKGKDWFVISAPKMFNSTVLAETPAIDASAIIGRKILVNVSQLTGQSSKYYMNLEFKIDAVDGKKASTVFAGYNSTRDYLFHVVRKRTEKVRHVRDVETRDGWKLQVIALLILNRKTEANVKSKIRKIIDEQLDSAAKRNGIDGFVKEIVGGSVQKEMKRLGNKVYPVRFSEIESIEVLKQPKAE
jgi:small subunit ribosomal protein S3Ae